MCLWVLHYHIQKNNVPMNSSLIYIYSEKQHVHVSFTITFSKATCPWILHYYIQKHKCLWVLYYYIQKHNKCLWILNPYFRNTSAYGFFTNIFRKATCPWILHYYIQKSNVSMDSSLKCTIHWYINIMWVDLDTLGLRHSSQVALISTNHIHPGWR